MEKGKPFEILVAQIEEALKGNPNFKISPDVVLEDRDGIKRQIDLLIEHRIDDRFTFKTIVECKDYSSRIKVGLIGEFINLLESLNVHQGIFVSRTGFQKSAIRKAQKNGRIKLHTLSEVIDNTIIDWFKKDFIKELRQNFQLVSYHIVADAKRNPGIIFPRTVANPLLRIDTTEEAKTPFEVTQLYVKENVHEEFEPVWYQFFFGKRRDLKWRLRRRDHIVSEQPMYILDGDQKIYLKSLDVEFDLWLSEEESNITSIHKYQDQSPDANLAYNIGTELTMKTENRKIKFNLVTSADGRKNEVFVQNENGQVEKMKRLAKIDPTKGTITPFEE